MKTGYLSEIFVSFQGEGVHVGRRHLFVRLAGCNLRCRYCDTPDSLERSNAYTVYEVDGPPRLERNPVSAIDLARRIRALIERSMYIDALALTGGEPLMQSEFLSAVLEAGQFNLPVLLETNGVLPRRLHDVLPFVQVISMDIKPPSNTGEGSFWPEHAAFLDLARTKELYVKILVDETTLDEDVAHALSMVAALDPAVPTFLQPILDPQGKLMISSDRLTHLYLLGRSRLESLRVLPQVHKLLGVR